MMRWIAAIAALLLPAAAYAQSAPFPGETYEIVRIRETASQDNRGGTSTSYDRNRIRERVLGVRENGLELEYDFPQGTKAEDRARDWSLPVRVFKPAHGPLQLLNTPELEARIDAWLKLGNFPREACGQWIFTWNAFKIECDPRSVLRWLPDFDLRPELRDGAPYSLSGALGTAPLQQTGTIYTAELKVDPEQVRRGNAETDVMVAGFNGEKLTLDQALARRSGETISGTITVRFETDNAGNVLRRVTVTKLETKGPGEKVQTMTVTETVERKLVTGPTT